MNEKCCVISGSTLGGAEYVAEHLAARLKTPGNSCALFHGPSLEEVDNFDLWLIVSSTHGAGELPENLQPLFDQIKQSEKDRSYLRFAVVGLGNSDYDTFCFAVDHIERALKEKGAKKLTESLKIDVLNTDDPESAAEQWLPNFTSHLA